MRNVALTEQLMDNIEQLRASRQRLVHAQDEERRKLERNLHDGAQQQLVALSVQAAPGRRARRPGSREDEDDARRTSRRRPGRRSRICATSRAASIRRCSRTRGWSRRSRRRRARRRSPPTVRGGGRRALSAAGGGGGLLLRARGAQQRGEVLGSRAAPRSDSAQSNGDLTFEVSDDGAGFDMRSARATGPGCAAWRTASRRSAASLDIRSAPGSGTSVAGRIPAIGGSDRSPGSHLRRSRTRVDGDAVDVGAHQGTGRVQTRAEARGALRPLRVHVPADIDGDLQVRARPDQGRRTRATSSRRVRVRMRNRARPNPVSPDAWHDHPARHGTPAIRGSRSHHLPRGWPMNRDTDH